MLSALREELRRFIHHNFLFGQANEQLSDADSLLENGVIDSTGVLELVTFLESRYGVTLEDEELVPENLDSIDRLVRFIERKRSGGRSVEPARGAGAVLAPSSRPS